VSETTSKSNHTLLDELSSTAIAGNDILSSCLYVCGIAIIFAGVYAPLIFLLIGAVLWLYKHVYTEVVEALPLNGGAYNCLLNATVKPMAAIAGVMTTLSYMATSVISAKTASAYLNTVFAWLPVIPVTAVIIVAFALLVIAGVKDSAKVAKAIFLFHIFVLTLFICIGLLMLFNNGAGFITQSIKTTNELFAREGAMKMLFFAFSASLLGVSGFESSANFVEEQQSGVFRKTLKNMLLGVVLFNPLIAIVILNTMDLSAIAIAKDFVLAESALTVGGNALKYLVVADAFLVLSGAVLASFVGASGLLYRMTLDHCFPSNILLPKLKKRNQNANRIIIAFAGLCISILLLTGGDLLSLAGVYTISFLGVMSLFAVGNIILRANRPDLKRSYRGPLLYTVLAASATVLGIVGNILIDPNNLLYFLLYFLPVASLVMLMIYRDYILEWATPLFDGVPFLDVWLESLLSHVVKPRIVLFAHHPHKLYRSLEYIRRNETSRNITVVFCRESGEQAEVLLKKFKTYIEVFKEANVFENIRIEFIVEEKMSFGPDLVKAYATRFRTNRNNIFIGSIHDTHEFSFEELGGVRIIQ
jgi:amino acid transporter